VPTLVLGPHAILSSSVRFYYEALPASTAILAVPGCTGTQLSQTSIGQNYVPSELSKMHYIKLNPVEIYVLNYARIVGSMLMSAGWAVGLASDGQPFS